MSDTAWADKVMMPAAGKAAPFAPGRYGFPAQHLPGFRAFLRDFSMWMVNTQDEP